MTTLQKDIELLIAKHVDNKPRTSCSTLTRIKGIWGNASLDRRDKVDMVCLILDKEITAI